MKHILSLIVIAVFMSFSIDPPIGNCKPDEVWRCSMEMCTSTLIYCPTVFENGRYVDTGCKNETECNWDYSCVTKQSKEDEE